MAEAHEAHAAARRDLTGSARAFLNETALPAIRALKGAGAPTLLPAMHRILNAIQPGLIGPVAALYGHWMEWRESNRSGRPLSMGDTLRLTGAGSAMSLRSSAQALLHALRTRYPGDRAPYLNQARATYPGGVFELDAALHLLHPPDEDLELGEITVFVEGADQAPARPRPTNPVYDGSRPTPPYAAVCEASPGSPPGAPPSRRRRTPPAAGPTQTCPPPSPEPGVPTTGGRPSGKSALAPPCSSSSSRLAGTRNGSWGSPPPTSMGQHPYPAPPPGACGAGRGTHLPANTGGHRRYWGPPSAAPPGTTRRPPGAQGPEPRPILGAVVRRVGRVAPPPPLPMPIDGRRPPPVRGGRQSRPLTPSPPPCRRALHGTAHGTRLMHQKVVGRAHLPSRMSTRVTVRADSDGSPQRDDRHHCRSRSRSPVSPEWAGETPAKREERRLAEVAVLVGPPAGQPRAASADTGPSTQEPEPAEVTPSAAQAASPAASPHEGAPDARGAETAALASHATAPTAAPGTPPTRKVAPAQEPCASPRGCRSRRGERGGRERGCDRVPREPRHRLGRPRRGPQHATKADAAAAAVGREGAKYCAHANPTHTHTSPPKPFPTKPFPPGRTRHVRPPAPERSLLGVTLPQLKSQRDARRVIQEGGEGAQAELRASHGSAERGTRGDRGSAQEHAQGAGQGTRSRKQGRSSGGGQSAGSGRRDSGQVAGKGPGHGKGAQGRGQGTQVHGAGQGTVGERAGQGVGDRRRDTRHGQGA